MVHLKTGKILLWGLGTGGPTSFETKARLWDPDNPDVSELVQNDTTNLFCAGHCALTDGRMLLAGGSFYVNPPPDPLPPDDVNFFDPDDTSHWRNPPLHMEFRRWYPTCTTLWDGRVLITSGYKSDIGSPPDYADKLEIYDPADDALQTLTPSKNQRVYAMMFVVPDGTLFHVGPSRLLARLKPPGADWEWDANVNETSPWAGMGHGSAVMYDAVAGLILKSGGANAEEDPGVKTTALFKYNKWPPPVDKYWKDGPDMVHARRNHDLVMLPDGTVLCVGGNLNGNSYRQSNTNPEPVYKAEIYDPGADTWTDTGVNMTDPRWYHSSALLLPDARVLTAGGNTSNYQGSPYITNSAQIFRPPYLDGDPDRASFAAPLPPSVMNYGSSYTIAYTHPEGLEIAKACLIKLAAVTHSFDEDQRYVPLTFTATQVVITVIAPANAKIAPPGYYMLFIVDTNGVPCVKAAYVKVA